MTNREQEKRPVEIKNRWDGSVIYVAKGVKDVREAVEAARREGADLREANLRRADLWGADLWRADLREANLRGAERKGRSWADSSKARPRIDTYEQTGQEKLLWEAA